MPDRQTHAPSRPFDAIDRDAAGAGIVHLRRAAAYLDTIRHELELAAACSDLCTVPDAATLLAQVENAIMLSRGVASAVVARDAARARATGIRARRCLPSPTYDYLFTLISKQGRALCVMVPGQAGYDPDYWEEVPPDTDPRATASPTR